jgi:hypothetical protein
MEQTDILGSDCFAHTMDRTSSCPSCGSKAWDMMDSDILQVIQCQTCGHRPTDRTSRYSNGRHSRHSKTLPEIDTSSLDERNSLLSEAIGIIEHDFASPKPRYLSGLSSQGIRSVRQSMIEPLPKPRWFELHESMTFQFKLTPRTTPFAKPITTSASSASTSSGISSSRPPNAAGPSTGTRGITISELSSDATAWQRLLTSALFLIKEENIPAKDAPPKIIDLGLLQTRQNGGKHLAMKHYAGKEHEALVQNGCKDEARRILWKVVVKTGSGK